MTTTVPRAGAKRFYSTGGADTSGLNSDSSMAFPLAAAIIPAAASVVGGAINALSQNSANNKNIEMQRETNEMNYRMFQEQNEWNLEQWKRENEYNSPSAQAERLRAAGINPAFVFGNGSISEASSLQSASPNAMVAPHTEPIMAGDMLAQGVYTGINAYNQSQLINAQTDEIRQRAHGLAIENDLKFAEISSRIANMNIDNDTKQMLLDILKATKDDEIALKKGSVKQQDAQTKLLIQQAASAKISSEVQQRLADSNIRLNESQIKQVNAAIKKISHEISLIDANVSLTEEQKLDVIEARTSKILDNELKGINNNIANQTKDAVINTIKQEYKTKKRNFEYSPSTPFTPWLQLPTRYFGSASDSSTYGVP